jgi:hypothetical protein
LLGDVVVLVVPVVVVVIIVVVVVVAVVIVVRADERGATWRHGAAGRGGLDLRSRGVCAPHARARERANEVRSEHSRGKVWTAVCVCDEMMGCARREQKRLSDRSLASDGGDAPP